MLNPEILFFFSAFVVASLRIVRGKTLDRPGIWTP